MKLEAMSDEVVSEEVTQAPSAPTTVPCSSEQTTTTGSRSAGVLALQQSIGNRATGDMLRRGVQRHQGEHAGPLHSHRIREVPVGTDVRALSRQVPEILQLVHSLRPDANLADDQVPDVSSISSIVVWSADYRMTLLANGTPRFLMEDPEGVPVTRGMLLLADPRTRRLWRMCSLYHPGEDPSQGYLSAQALGNRLPPGDENAESGPPFLIAAIPDLRLSDDPELLEQIQQMIADADEAAERARRRREGPPDWARAAGQGAASRRRQRRRRRDRRRREAEEQQERAVGTRESAGGPTGTEDGTGTGVRGHGTGGGGESTTGVGTGVTGTGTGRSTDSNGPGRGRGGGAASEENQPLQGPENINVEVSRRGRLRLRITIDGATTRINLREGESDRSLDRRVDRAIDDLQRSRDPNAQGEGVHEGADETGFSGESQEGELGGEVPEGERRGPGGAGPEGEEGGSGSLAQDPAERVAGGDNIANTPAYPSSITMAGYQRPERREGDPEPLNIAADVNAPTTVLGANNDFTMSLDYAARSVGTLDEVVNRLQSINFYWELIKVDGLDEEAAEQRARETGVGEGEQQTARMAAGDELSQSMNDIADDQERDIEMMREQNWSWEARAAYLGVIGLSNSVRMVGSVISTFVSIVTTPRNERSIGFDQTGEYIVRCVATPNNTDEAMADPDNHVIRASSVAVMPIRVQNISERLDESMSAEERNLERLQALLDAATTEEKRREARLRLEAAQRDLNLSGMGAFTATLNGLRNQLRLAERLKRLQDDGVPEGDWDLPELQLALDLAVKRQTVEPLISQVRAQLRAYGGEGADTGGADGTGTAGSGEHERWVSEQHGEFRRGAQDHRPRIVLASRVTGQVTPILAMLGEMPRANDADPPTWRLVDITSPGSRDHYEGETSLTGEEGHQEAIRRAFREFAEGNPYGRGTIAVRLPPQLLRRYGENISIPSRFVSAPGSTERALQRLQDLATVAEIAGLFVTGPAGLALGAVGAVAGLASSIDSLARRTRTGHLVEAGTLFDIAGVVGGVAGLSGLGAGLTRMHLDDLARTGQRIPSWVSRVDQVEGVLRIHGIIDNVQQLVAIPHQLVVQMEAAANIEPESERRKAVAMAMLGAIRSGGMMFIQTAGGFHSDPNAHPDADTDLLPESTPHPPPRSDVDVDVGAADAHAEGRGPAIRPHTEAHPVTPDADSETRQPQGEGEGQPLRVEPPSESETIAAAEARGRRRIREASEVMSAETPTSRQAPPRPPSGGAESDVVGSDRRPPRRALPTPPPGSHLMDLVQQPEGGDAATRARAALLQVGDMGVLRRQLEQMTSLTDDQRASAARQLQDARSAVISEHVATVLQELHERYPDLHIEVQDFGTQGLASDRDITVRAEPRDPSTFAALSDAERAAIDRSMVAASAEAVPLLYGSLEASGISPERALDTNFYTDLHESLVRPADRAEALAIATDQQIVSLSEVLLNTSAEQWQSYVDGQLAMIDGQRGTPAEMRRAMRERFLAQVEAAEASGRRLLGALPADVHPRDLGERRGQALQDARQRLLDALQRDPPPSARELRQHMADVKLLEPDAYGTRQAVEGVVLGGQALRGADLHPVLEDGFRRESDIAEGVGERGPHRFDPESGQMVEVSAEQEVARRRAEAQGRVGHRRPGDSDATAFEINAPRLAAAEAVLGHLLGHLPDSGGDYTDASTAAKNLGRIAELAHDSGIRRASGRGFAHLSDIVAAKGASDAPAATREALQGWASDRSVRAWASSEGLSLRTDQQRLSAFMAWATQRGHSLVGRMRRRTSAAAVAEEAPVGRARTAPPSAGRRMEPADVEPTARRPARRAETEPPPDGDAGEATIVTRRTRSTERDTTTDPEPTEEGADITSGRAPPPEAEPTAEVTAEAAEAPLRQPHVGEDGVIDLDHPANRHLTDGMVGALPGNTAFDPVAATAFYEDFIAAHPDLESALVRNTATGEFLIIQGNELRTDPARLNDAVGELLPPSRAGRGRWVFESHSHPVDPTTGVTPAWSRVPSLGDIHGAAVEAEMGGRPSREEIRVRTESGPATVHFGYDPGAARPITIEVPNAEGGHDRHSFDTIEAYADWFAQEFGQDAGPIPDDFPGARRGRPPAGRAPEDTTPGRRDAPTVPRRTRSGDIIDEPDDVESEVTDRRVVRREFYDEDDHPDWPRNPRYHADSRLSDDGTMTMDFSLREERGGEMHRAGQLRGGAEFTAALDHFRRVHGPDAVRRIQGNWGRGDNLEHFQARTRQLVGLGMPLHDAQVRAASETATGRWAEDAGFGHIARVDVSGDEVSVVFEPGPSNAPPVPTLPTPRMAPNRSDSDGETDADARAEQPTPREGLPAIPPSIPESERRSSTTDEEAAEGARRPTDRPAATPSQEDTAGATPASGPPLRHLPEVRRSLEATFDRSGPPPEAYVQAAGWFEFYETWRGDDPDRQGEVPQADAYFDRDTRQVYLAPTVPLPTVAHESLHALTHDAFHVQVSDWLNEGVTDLYTEDSIGHRSEGSAYDDNVEIARLVRDAVGDDVLRGAYFDGNIAALEAALDAHVGDAGILERLNFLLPSDGSARADPDFLSVVRRLLTGSGSSRTRGDRSDRPTVPPGGIDEE